MMKDELPGNHPEAFHVSDYKDDFTRLLNMLYADLETQIARADQKAQIILSADAILVAVLANFGFNFEFFPAAEKSVIALIIIGLQLVAFILLISSLFFALRVALPQFRGSVVPTPSVFYSEHITALTKTEYIEEFMSLSLQDVKQMVMADIHAKAQVARSKFSDVRHSMIAVMLAVLTIAIAQILSNFIG